MSCFVIAGTSASNDFGEGQVDAAAPVQKIGQAISDLAAAGAKNLLVMGNIAPPDFHAALATQFNAELSSGIVAQRLTNIGLTIYEFDADQVLSDVLANPKRVWICKRGRPGLFRLRWWSKPKPNKHCTEPK